jgi:peptide/nickel transport system ATP-binding protein
MNVLEIRNLKVDFQLHDGMLPAVRDISFKIPHAKTVALVGESGSGKSVTAQAIMRILPKIAHISGGQILLQPDAGEDVTDIAKLDTDSDEMRDIRGGKISMIFQEPMVSLSPLHTIGNQVSESVLLHQNVNSSQALKLTRDMLDMVGFPDPDRALKTYPFELSGGLRQRAMIATALVCKPALLIADEPTTALDVTIQAQILKLMKDMQQELQMAVLLITHDLGVVANIADEVVVMYHGEIMESGGVEDIYSNPQHPYLKALIQAVPHFDMKPGERLIPVREIEAKLGHLLKGAGIDQQVVASKVHLSVKNLTRSFYIRNTSLFGQADDREIRAVDDVSFEVLRGECFGLVGESGCGKTTLSKILMKALQPDSGEIRYFDSEQGTDVLSLKDESLFDFRRQMQFIFQDPFSSLNPRMTVYDIIREPLVIHKAGDEDYQIEMVSELMRLVGLDPRFLSRYPHSFSGGQRQRLGIARALALQPEFLICDEPVSALDVSIQAQVLNLLKDLQAELNLTYIFISHNLAVVDYIADRIAVMCNGRLVEIARKEELFNNPVHPYTKALLTAVPFPDLNKPLDFELVMDGKSSEPTAWPMPYTSNEHVQTRLTAVSPGHFVQTQIN